jgi:methylase of polypeptide subunit release factors
MEFNKPYNRTEFVTFLRTKFLPEDFVQEEESINLSSTNYATSAIKLGTSESLQLVVYEVKHNSRHDARVGLSRDAFRMLADEYESRALVLFVPEDSNDNYRFSFIELTLSPKDDSSHLKRAYSNPRRYSYFLGKDIAYYTPNKYLNEAGRVQSVNDLRERFSVDILTKAFYKELSNWYAWAIGKVHFPNDITDPTDNEKYNHESTIRLITRLIFVWFLKQRGLIPWQFFDEQYIAEHLIKGFTPNAQVTLFGKSEDSHYYKGILQNLFFAMLNSPLTADGSTEVNQRHFRKLNDNGTASRSDFDNNKLMRYEELFIDPQHFVDLANSTVPFLNGGLFDCLDDKINGMYLDAFTDKDVVSRQLIVPDYLFFGEEVGKDVDLSKYYGDKTKKNVSTTGIIDLLKRYNFTVEENTPFDQDVSLDPELLGQVFENLLAAYNPETQTTARKQTGSFYTPREIVQYMVDESLIAHLCRTVDSTLEPKFRQLVQYTDEDLGFSLEQRKAIMQSLYSCKVLDPACGSGAFPVGVLQQMVHILNRIDPDNAMWKEMMKKHAGSEASEAYMAATDEERKEILSDIDRSFDESVNRPDYARKLYLIENCIYGVDIQPIAIQISKLRFFISLVVDQKINNNPADNFGIRPLPNLEAKFVAANSLVGLQKQEASLFDLTEVKQKESALKIAKHKIFSAKTVRTKKKWKDAVSSLRQEIANILYENHCVGNTTAQELAAWDMFDQNKFAPFFDTEWMFDIKDGFDIVIANPPYGASFTAAEKKYFKDAYKHQNYQPESYLLFIEKGLSLTSKNGCLTYIIPNTWLTNVTPVGIRKLLFGTTTINNIVHLAGDVFKAVVDTEIISLVNQHVSLNNNIKIINKRAKESESWSLMQADLENTNGQPISLFVKEEYRTIVEKLNQYNRLENYCIVTQGAKPFQSGKGTPKQTKEIVKSKPYVSEFYQDGFSPLLRGSLMDRFCIKWEQNYWIKFGVWLAEPRPSAHYDASCKIIIRQTGDSIIAAIDTQQFIVRDNLYTCINIDSNTDLYTILGLLNSTLVNWFYQNVLNNETGEVLAQVKKAHLVKLPIATISDARISNLCQAIMHKRDNGLDWSSEYKELDYIIYKVYGLTFDEVCLVDPQTSITKESYDVS